MESQQVVLARLVQTFRSKSGTFGYFPELAQKLGEEYGFIGLPKPEQFLPSVETGAEFQHGRVTERAIEIARKQSAKSEELRATISLARLLERQGCRDEARRMLGDIYNWFTEGFDIADLKDAKTFLDELSI